MRFGFREGMEQYGDIAKGEMEARRLAAEKAAAEASLNGESAREAEQGEDAAEAKDLDSVLSWHLDRRAKKTGTSVEAQKEVYEVQKRKQGIMERLHRDLAALDNPEAAETAPEGSRPVRLEKGKLLCAVDDGRGGSKEVEVTLGDLLTDGAWGMHYALDKATVPRMTRKKMMVERARQEIANLLDEQILIEEIDSDRTHEFTREAYLAIRDRRESGELPFGIVAERMVTQIARKMIIDGGKPFTYENADVFQDVNQKIDFIIRQKDYGRGVKVEGSNDEEVHAKGVQLTINQSQEAYQRKREQIERSKRKLAEDDRIDDIALMRVDQRVLGSAYDQWAKTKLPGGPDKQLGGFFKEKLFKEMTSGMQRDKK